MWEKETRYKLSLKKNLIYEFASVAYKESQNFDVHFITSDNFKIPAHRIILALNSDLIKSLQPEDFIQIMVPDFSKSVVEGFVQFMYSGKALIDLSERSDFISLCNEMMVNVPGLSAGTDETFEENTEKEPLEEDVNEEAQPEDEMEQTFNDEMVIASPEEDLLEDDNENKHHVDTEDNFFSKIPDKHDAESSQDIPKPFYTRKIVKRAAQRITIARVEGSYSMDHNSSNELSAEPKIQEAIKAVKWHGMNVMKAAKTYGVPKTTLYRKLKDWKRHIE